MADWHLLDVEQKAQAHPDSFFIPSKEVRESQAAGQLVQLHFALANPGETEPHAERMWVTISQILPLGQGYEGILENQPSYIKDLQIGDVIKFQPCHIGQVLISRDDPEWLEIWDKIALVSNLVFEGEKTVRFLYREKPDDEKDSGWRLLSGDETDEYNRDANNISLRDIGWLLDFDPSLLEVFKHDYDVAFERTSKISKWRQIKDWQSPQE